MSIVFLPFLRCEHVRVDGRTNERLFVGDMSTLLTLSPFSPHRYPYLSHPSTSPIHPTNRRRPRLSHR